MKEGNGLFSKMKEENVSEETIVRVFGDLIIAAGDTVSPYFSFDAENNKIKPYFQTSNTTIWILHNIAKDINLQNALKLESLQPFSNQPLSRGCLKESMRLYPVAPFIGRFLDSAATINGYNIPKMTLALMSLYSSSRDPNYFPDPDNFSPDRWGRMEAQSVLKNVINSRGTIPFALGARSCIGKRMANYQMQYLLMKVRFKTMLIFIYYFFWNF